MIWARGINVLISLFVAFKNVIREVKYCFSVHHIFISSIILLLSANIHLVMTKAKNSLNIFPSK